MSYTIQRGTMDISTKLDTKSILAKLFASENITIRHANIPTAAFDVKNKVLLLPVWKDVTNEVYNLLISHEVGHALYTPQDVFEKEVAHEDRNFKSIVNIVEDARIEKLIQNKFPGLRKDYFKGYKDLIERKLFDTPEKSVTGDLNDFDLINRINLHFKLKDHINVPFSKEEDVLVKKVDSCKTFEDVLRVSRELYENYSNPAPEEKQQCEVEGEGEGEPSDGDGSQQAKPKKGDPESDQNGNSPKQFPGDSTESENKQSKSGLDNFESNKQSLLNDDNVGEVSYISIPSDEYLKDCYTSNKAFIQILKEHYERNGHCASKSKNRIIDVKSINYMHKIFEQKKAAETHKRISIAKTGLIDTNKLSKYKFKDDIFLRHTTVKEGKNHGLMMFVDFSGSMSDVIKSVLVQTLELVEFCRKSRIKYRVYSFTDNSHYGNKQKKDLLKEGDFVINSNTNIVEIMSDEMTPAETNLVVDAIANNRFGGNYYSDLDILAMGGTPLFSTMVVSDYLIRKFKKETNVEILNFVVLTDGAPTDTILVNDKNCIPRHLGSGYHPMGKDVIYVEYSKSNVIEIKEKKLGQYSTISSLMYYNYIKFLKNRYDMNTIIIDLVNARNNDISNHSDRLECWGKIKDKKSKSLGKNCGEFVSLIKEMAEYFTKYFVINQSIIGKKEAKFSKMGLQEINEYMTSENSTFNEKSIFLRIFAEIISK
jgi:hypothetical protein